MVFCVELPVSLATRVERTPCHLADHLLEVSRARMHISGWSIIPVVRECLRTGSRKLLPTLLYSSSELLPAHSNH